MKYFETIKCENFDVYNLHYHEKRIMNTIARNFSLSEFIYPPSKELLKCKVVYNEDEILSIEFSPYKKKEIKSFKFICDNKIEYTKKMLNRECINILYNQKDNTDEIIIVKNNLISDTSIANIAIFDGDIWLTPKTPLLKGTIRAKLLQEGEIFEKDISVKMFKEAKKVALMNAMIGFDVLKTYSCLS